MIKPELKALQPVIPGYAQLLLKAWKGGMDGVMISVLRNQDSLYLDNDGGWSSAEVFLALPTLTLDEGVPTVQVGPSLVDPLLANRQAAYRIAIKDDASRDMGILMISEGLLSSQAGGENPLPVNTRSLNDTPPTPPAVEPTPPPVPEPAPVVSEAPAPQPVEEPKAKRGKGLIIALVVLLLLIAAAAAAWWFMRSPEAPAEETPPPAAAPAAAAKVSGPCGDDLMTKGNELAFVKGCLRSQPSSAQLLEVIAKAKAAKQCDVAQRLYAYKAQSGDTQMAMRYAEEYDPKTAQSGGCFSPDAQTAIYWYEIVVNQDSQNSGAKARLAELKK